MKLKKAEKQIVPARDFNDIKIFRSEGMLVKTSKHVQTIESEKEWYRRLPKELEFIHPRIFDIEHTGSLTMEYLDYPTAHQLYMEGKTSAAEWIKVFASTKRIMDSLSQKALCKDIYPEESRSLLRSMYIEKTEKRLSELANDSIFRPIYLYDVEINGKRYISVGEMINTIQRAVWWAVQPIKKAPIIHGDLHLGNMLVSSGGENVKLIDPRGSFGKYTLNGDVRYDIAKLMHSIEGGYDLIVEDSFALRYDVQRRSIRYSFSKGGRNRKAEFAFAEVFGKDISEDRRSLTMIEALLFFSMIPLHTESKKRQLVMLSRGYELAEKALGSINVRA